MQPLTSGKQVTTLGLSNGSTRRALLGRLSLRKGRRDNLPRRAASLPLLLKTAGSYFFPSSYRSNTSRSY